MDEMEKELKKILELDRKRKGYGLSLSISSQDFLKSEEEEKQELRYFSRFMVRKMKERQRLIRTNMVASKLT